LSSFRNAGGPAFRQRKAKKSLTPPQFDPKSRKTKENRKKPVETEENRLTFLAERLKVNGGRFSGAA
jgi:hypothetical protein